MPYTPGTQTVGKPILRGLEGRIPPNEIRIRAENPGCERGEPRFSVLSEEAARRTFLMRADPAEAVSPGLFVSYPRPAADGVMTVPAADFVHHAVQGHVPLIRRLLGEKGELDVLVRGVQRAHA